MANNKIIRSPERYGWAPRGKIIAPWYSDPYVHSDTIAQEILKEKKPDLSADQVRDVILPIFLEWYKKTDAPFFSETKITLEHLARHYDVNVVVTNSSSDVVGEKLKSIGLSHLSVSGSARKFELNDSWDVLPVALEPNETGFSRPIYLRRKEYFDRLVQVTNGFKPSEVCVVGDIYEMDLALPAYLGMHTVLIANNRTPECERDLASRTSKVAYTLKEVPHILVKTNNTLA
jgi:FMN phosphatase YigB (HAD superfamily)